MSKDYNFRTGVSCKNNLGQEAELTGVVIKKVNIETEEEDVLTEQQAILMCQEKEKLLRKQLLSEVQRNNRKQICVIQIKK